MQLFGGNFNFPEGRPTSNFDTITNALLTVFQVKFGSTFNLILENYKSLCIKVTILLNLEILGRSWWSSISVVGIFYFSRSTINLYKFQFLTNSIVWPPIQ